ncbi:hypothetical protein ONS95_003006 [Cadophora gregata]|uniref:uncharacterized protein n=1 Tax=Cadophora gregata TaxID=51156 RepID=UPI0026DAED37|nr:uncharacterized protein ONS95_003006 [Cadophora gregata]KAK0108184.1 hypothetical protein ONS95_003006 [Cadophora gregata]
MITLEAQASDSVLEVKHNLQAKGVLPVNQQRLVYAGRQLLDERTLADYNIWNGAILQVVLKLRGGGDGRFDVRVQLPDKREIVIRLESSDIIQYLRALIAASEDIPPRNLSVYCGETRLQDGRSLKDYRISENSTVRAVCSIPGPQQDDRTSMSPGFEGVIIKPSLLCSPSSFGQAAQLRSQQEEQVDFEDSRELCLSQPETESQDSTGSFSCLQRDFPRYLTPNSPQGSEVPIDGPSFLSFQAIMPTPCTPRMSKSVRGFRCDDPSCLKVFPTPQARRKHLRYHNRPHRCQQCDRSFGTVTHLTRHVNDIHEKQIHYCPVGGCEYSLAAGNGKSFAREWNLMRHLSNMH